MAFFLLLYVVGALIWAAWAGILTYHAVKYRFPKDNSRIILLAFWGVSGLILLISILFISRADWLTVPAIFKSL
jgi:membrane protein DedA with SNARE-associated domain